MDLTIDSENTTTLIFTSRHCRSPKLCLSDRPDRSVKIAVFSGPHDGSGTYALPLDGMGDRLGRLLKNFSCPSSCL